MPKKAKVGKQRKDKFYKLAKEKGYRSRAAFKLLQLNRKFEFLPNCKYLVDLCAAPGGWLQVAQEAMPVNSWIIGIDLVPIKYMGNRIITKEGDITTDICRQALKKELAQLQQSNKPKCQVFLHDGAPNVGQNWIQDAFTQNQLTLSALKLASEFLDKKGWFITKVFRSKDHQALIWAFKKLFKHVHITKPAASRNESAEIFVVCEKYLGPDRIDEKFFDPGYLFKDVKDQKETKNSILAAITKKKPKAEGYDDESPLYSSLKASDFIFCENPVERLGKCNNIVFDDDDIENHKLTTDEIKQCCKDIKVLGKAEIKLLLNWKKQITEAVKKAEKPVEKSDLDRIDQNEDKEIECAFKEAEDLELSKLQEAKRKKKKVLKERKKLHDRINLKMIIKDDEPIIDEDRELFKLSQIKNKTDLNKVEDEDDLEFSLEQPQTEVETVHEYKKLHTPYDRHTADDYGIEAESADKEESVYSSDEYQGSELEFESESENASDNENDVTETILQGIKNPLMVDLVDRPDHVKDTVNKWFDKDDFAEANEEEADLELDLLAETLEKKKIITEPKEEKSGNEIEAMDIDKSDTEKIDEESTKSAQGDKTNSILKTADKKETNQGNKVKKKKKKKVKLDPEALALGSLLVQSKKMKRDIIESAYNRYAFTDENLPHWFVNDEKKHFRKQLPVTAEMVSEYKQRLREINARPIRKVVEAKGRKKRRAVRRMEKARTRAEKITEHPDMSDKEKAEQLKAIYKKALPKKDPDVTYVVAKKGIGRRVPRPSGVKGRYKVVDPRMKKDDRKEKLAFKSKKSGKRNMKQKQKMKKRK